MCSGEGCEQSVIKSMVKPTVRPTTHCPWPLGLNCNVAIWWGGTDSSHRSEGAFPVQAPLAASKRLTQQWIHELMWNDDTYVPCGFFFSVLFATYCHGVLLCRAIVYWGVHLKGWEHGGESILNQERNWKEMFWKSALSLDSAKKAKKKAPGWFITWDKQSQTVLSIHSSSCHRPVCVHPSCQKAERTLTHGFCPPPFSLPSHPVHSLSLICHHKSEKKAAIIALDCWVNKAAAKVSAGRMLTATQDATTSLSCATSTALKRKQGSKPVKTNSQRYTMEGKPWASLGLGVRDYSPEYLRNPDLKNKNNDKKISPRSIHLSFWSCINALENETEREREGGSPVRGLVIVGIWW